jgi:hypothetical protein
MVERPFFRCQETRSAPPMTSNLGESVQFLGLNKNWAIWKQEDQETGDVNEATQESPCHRCGLRACRLLEKSGHTRQEDKMGPYVQKQRLPCSTGDFPPLPLSSPQAQAESSHIPDLRALRTAVFTGAPHDQQHQHLLETW